MASLELPPFCLHTASRGTLELTADTKSRLSGSLVRLNPRNRLCGTVKITFDRSYDRLIASFLSREDAELVVESPDHSDIVAEVGHTNLTLRSKLIDDGKTSPYFAVVMSSDEREQIIIRAGLAVRRDVLVDEARATPDRLLRIVADAVGEPMRVGNSYKTFIEDSTITIGAQDPIVSLRARSSPI